MIVLACLARFLSCWLVPEVNLEIVPIEIPSHHPPHKKMKVSLKAICSPGIGSLTGDLFEIFEAHLKPLFKWLQMMEISPVNSQEIPEVPEATVPLPLEPELLAKVPFLFFAIIQFQDFTS